QAPPAVGFVPAKSWIHSKLLTTDNTDNTDRTDLRVSLLALFTAALYGGMRRTCCSRRFTLTNADFLFRSGFVCGDLRLGSMHLRASAFQNKGMVREPRGLGLCGVILWR